MELLNDQVDQLILDHDGLADLAGSLCQEGCNLVVCQHIGNDSVIVQVGIHHNSTAHLTIDLNSDGDFGILALVLAVGGPRLVSDGVVMTQNLPDLFAHVGDDAGDHLDEALCVLSGAGAVLVDFVDEDHHLGNGSIEAQGLEVRSDLLDSLVVDLGQLAVIGIGDVLSLGEEVPDTVDELLGALDAIGIYRCLSCSV